PKRAAIFTVVRHLIKAGRAPEEIAAIVSWRQKSMFRIASGVLTSAEFVANQTAEAANGGRSFEARRFYCGDGELFHHDGRTYAFTNQWGQRCTEAIDLLLEAYPEEPISYQASI
ncbi:MAG: hypothetical protein WD049_08260, partial [Candidatus Paceibacterota bacterium]